MEIMVRTHDHAIGRVNDKGITQDQRPYGVSLISLPSSTISILCLHTYGVPLPDQGTRQG